MRLGDADRDELCEILSTHAALGRLELDELERRVAQVIAAQTREEATAVLADLPPLPRDRPSAGVPGSGRRHGDADRPHADWTPTQERFRDPRSGRVMRVWADPTGGRHYIQDD